MDLSREDLTAFEPDGFEDARREMFGGVLWLFVRLVGLLWLESVFKLAFFFRSLLLFISCIIIGNHQYGCLLLTGYFGDKLPV